MRDILARLTGRDRQSEQVTGSPLFCLITGFGRGGTTMLSELIRQHPNVEGRFECGFLLCDHPQQFLHFNPYASNLRKAWGLSRRDLRYLCKADSWDSMYSRLLERSNIRNKQVRIYDKTPGYMRKMRSVMGKVDVPCVTIVRDPRALYWSQKRRDNISLKQFIKYFRVLAGEWHKAAAEYDNMLLVRYEELCLDSWQQAKRIFEFLELEFRGEYIKLENPGDPYVIAGGINSDRLQDYRGNISEEEEVLILEQTADFSDWHWYDEGDDGYQVVSRI